MKKVIIKDGDVAEVVDASVGDLFSTIFSGKEHMKGAAALCQKGGLLVLGAFIGGRMTTGSWNLIANVK